MVKDKQSANKALNAHFSHQIDLAIEFLTLEDRTWLIQQTANVRDAVLNAFAFSPFLVKVCQQYKGLIQQLHLPLSDMSCYASDLKTIVNNAGDETAFNQLIRHYRHQQMAKVLFWDCLSKHSIERSLQHVSALADALIMCAYNWHFSRLAKRWGVPRNQQQLCIIAMGKLGGGELNFSSDIDLMFAYPEKGDTITHKKDASETDKSKSVEHQLFFTRLAQKVIQALDQNTTDGQVFRVDMRLRPNGESGPLVIHFDAFEDYYQCQAREWERFAMVKARIVNPVSKYTRQLEDIISPFVYKRYIDFTSVESLRQLKLKIFADSRRKQLSNNIKLGKGGIREAEFIVQSFQLIRAGQHHALQNQSWLHVLDCLENTSYLQQNDATQLKYAYLFLRKLEHALQQIDNQQTQTLPAFDETDQWQRLCFYMQYDTTDKLLNNVEKATQTIHSIFNQLLANDLEEEYVPTDEHKQLKLLWVGDTSREELAAFFRARYSEDCVHELSLSLHTFKQKVEKSHLSSRGRERIDQLVPLLIMDMQRELQNTTCIASAFERVIQIFTAVLGRTTYLDLLYENPNVRSQLLDLCEKSPWIAEQIRRFPLLLDELLSGAYVKQQSTDIELISSEFEDELRQTTLRVEIEDVEQYMDVLRQFKLSQQLRIAAADLQGTLPIEKVSDKLTILAEVILKHAIQTAYQQMVNKFGAPQHTDDPILSFGAVAYGKLGGYELSYGSDLDLVFVYDAPAEAFTAGSKRVSAQQFYIKLAQRVMHMLNTTLLLGQLYETDLRLRPAGNAGLLCCHISGFAHYQEKEAWTWEHQALVRSRMIFGGTSLRQLFTTIRNSTLSAMRDIAELKNDVSSMRIKLFEHSLKKSDKDAFKHGMGGITDIEFLCQFWVLSMSQKHKVLTRWPDNLRILEEVAKLDLLDKNIAQKLKRYYLSQRDAMHRSQLLDTPLKVQLETLEETREDIFRIWQTILPTYIHS